MNKRFSVIAVLCFVLTFSLFAGKADEKKLLSLVPASAVQNALANAGFFGAVEVEDGLVNFCVTEKASKDDLDRAVSAIKEVKA